MISTFSLNAFTYFATDLVNKKVRSVRFPLRVIRLGNTLIVNVPSLIIYGQHAQELTTKAVISLMPPMHPINQSVPLLTKLRILAQSTGSMITLKVADIEDTS